MTLLQNDVQDKESRENKFLGERIIRKALDKKEIDDSFVDEITKLFATTLAQYKGSAIRTRAEILMATLRNYVAGKGQTDEKVNKLQKTPSVSATFAADKESDEIAQTNDVESTQKEEKDLLQKIINEKIVTANLSEQLHKMAYEVILSETQHIIGTGVNERVVGRSVAKALEIFKQEHKPKTKQQDDSEKDSQKKNLKTSEKAEDKRSADDSRDEGKRSTDDSVDEEKDEEQPTRERRQSLTEIVLQRAREDDVKNPLKPHTRHWPTSTVSFGVSPSHKNSPRADFTENVTANDGADETLPTQKVDAPKQEPKLQNKAESQNFHEKKQPQAPILNGQASDLSSASNTKMVFDGNLELESSRVEAKHSLYKQDKTLFDKYIAEQVDAIMKIIAQNNDLPDDMQSGIQDDLTKSAMKISADNNISISERMHRLDTFFQEQKTEYTTKKVGNDFNPEDIIGDIIKRSEKEVNTGDQEADFRFRKTLYNTLSFKARHLVGSGQDPDSIKTALNEEYAKHKSFYIKNT